VHYLREINCEFIIKQTLQCIINTGYWKLMMKAKVKFVREN